MSLTPADARSRGTGTLQYVRRPDRLTAVLPVYSSALLMSVTKVCLMPREKTIITLICREILYPLVPMTRYIFCGPGKSVYNRYF